MKNYAIKVECYLLLTSILTTKITTTRRKIFTLFIFLLINLKLFKCSASSQYCNLNYKHLFFNINNYNPQFYLPVFTTEPIRVNVTNANNILKFQIYDSDTRSNNVTQFTNVFVQNKFNNLNFFVRSNSSDNTFTLGFNGELSYYINLVHRYELTIVAYDDGSPQRSSTASVIIPLLNANKFAPQYDGIAIINVDSNKNINELIGALNAYDLDGDDVSYYILNESDFTDTVEVTCEGRLILKKPLNNFYPRNSFNLVVELRDNGSPIKTSKMNVTINIIFVNAYTPRFIQNSNGINYCNSDKAYEIPENTLVEFEINVYDEDSNAKLNIFSLTNVGRDPQNNFTLNNTLFQNGFTRKALVRNNIPFDYEKPLYGTNSFQIMFYATDDSMNPRYGYCFINIKIIDINDNPPALTEPSYSLTIINQYQLRQWSFLFLATDADLNSKITYTILPPTQIGQIDYREIFNLTNDGLLSIRNTSFINNNNGPFSFFIQTSDGTFNSGPTQVNITKITSSIPPVFVNYPDPPEILISELITPGTQIAKFDVFIQNNNLSGLYLRCYLLRQSYEPFKFEFTQQRQILSSIESCTLNANEPLSYSKSKKFIIYLVAEVGNQQTGQSGRQIKPFIINVKEENKFVPSYFHSVVNISVVEGNNDVGNVIAIAFAYDLDLTESNNRVFYSLSPTRNFIINSTNGQIKLINGTFNEKIVNLEVRVSNSLSGTPYSTQFFNALIIDINNNPPKALDQNFSITQIPIPNLVVGKISSFDPDNNSNLHFFSMNSIFSAKNGTLTLNFYPKIGQYYFKVIISDGYFSTEINIAITFVNFNSNPPALIRDYTFNIPESSENVVLGQLQASGDYGLIFDIYSTPFINKSWFSINSTTGLLRLTSKIDADKPYAKDYVLPISVSDRFGNKSLGSLSSFSIVRLVLIDTNDNAPILVFINSSIQQSLTIDVTKPQESVDFFIFDIDLINGRPFQLKQNNLNDLFQVSFVRNDVLNTELWTLKATNTSNNYLNSVYFMIYTVTDNQNKARNGTLKIKITGQSLRKLNQIIQIDINPSKIHNLAVVRYNGLTVEEFLDYQFDQFKTELSLLLGLSEGSDTLSIISIKNYTMNDKKRVPNEIFFDKTLYGCEINFLVWKNNKYLSVEEIFFRIRSSSIIDLQIVDNICNFYTNFCPSDLLCTQMFIPSRKITTISSNTYSINGLSGSLEPSCICKLDKPPNQCLNGGTTVYFDNSKFYCLCPGGFTGPNCEQLIISFKQDLTLASISYAKFPPIIPCEPFRIEFQFVTSKQNCLMLFNGAINTETLLFLSIELINGNLVLQFGDTKLTLSDANLADSQWHHVDISLSVNVLQVTIDNCYSKFNNNTDVGRYKADFDSKNGTMNLVLGGILPQISNLGLYSKYLSNYQYEGCINDLKINGKLRDLKLISDQKSALNSCSCELQNSCSPKQASTNDLSFLWWIILIVLGVLILLALIIGFIVYKQRKIKRIEEKPSIICPNDDTREVVINYREEAGEENTKDFNLKKIAVYEYDKNLIDNRIVFDSIHRREPNVNDDYLKYSTEGVNSDAGSLSTISSEYTTGQRYRILHENDPRLTKIFEVYGYDVDLKNYENMGYEIDEI